MTADRNSSPAEAEMVLVPREPTKAMWSGLACDIVQWWSFEVPTGRTLYSHLGALGREVPEWLRDTIADRTHVPAKGDVAAAIYHAFLTAAPKATEAPGLREALEPLAKLGGHLSERDTMAGLLYRAAFWDCPEDVVIYQDGMGGVISVGDVRRARHALSATPQPVAVPDDVVALVIAARNVAFDDAPSREALRELDQASEAFAERIPWDDEDEYDGPQYLEPVDVPDLDTATVEDIVAGIPALAAVPASEPAQRRFAGNRPEPARNLGLRGGQLSG